MTDYTLADEISAVWDEVRPEFVGAFHADTYEVLRMTRVSDGRGGWTTEEGVVESGRCSLSMGDRQGREGLSGDVVESTVRQSAELPLATDAKSDDVLRVNGRRFRIIAIAYPGEHDLFPVADLEAVT